MKKLLLIPLFMLFSGCVSYYTPVNAIQDGVYYAEDDPEYTNTAYTNTAVVYNQASYYPWASLDYFYLGASPFYPSYSYGFGGYVGSGFSISISSGYSPWYTPYYSHYRPYGYYSPWYGYPRYGYGYQRYGYGYGNYYGRPGYGNCDYGNCSGRYNRGKGHKRGRGYSDDRYTGNDRSDRRSRNYRDRDSGEDYASKPVYKGDRGRRNDPDALNKRATRYISTSPDSQAGNQGVVVRNRGDAKQPQKSRTHQQPTRRVGGQDRSRITPVRQPKTIINEDRSRITPVQRPKPSTNESRSRTTPVQRAQPHRQSGPAQQRTAPQRQPAPVVRKPNNGRSAAPPPANSVRKQPRQSAPKPSRARSNSSRSKVSRPTRSTPKNRNRDRD